jgi:hypothetical protein
MLSQQNKNEVLDRYVDEGQEDTMLPGGVGSSSLTGGVVFSRGGRPSPEMLRGSGALPTRESDSGAPPRRESISFCRCGQRKFDSGDVASFEQRSSFLR